MLLQALHEYAQDENLVEAIELTDRTIHLVLVLDENGEIDPEHAWHVLSSPSKNPKKGETKEVPGQSMRMPRFPGENNGGKADFLADTCGPVLGVEPKTGKPAPRRSQTGEKRDESIPALLESNQGGPRQDEPTRIEGPSRVP